MNIPIADGAVRPPGHGAAMEVDTVSVVVPVLNAYRHLMQTVPALLDSVAQIGGEVIFVDNGSTDGSYEYLLGLPTVSCRVLRLEGATIAAIRNYGAQHASGTHLSFLDADCLILGPEYFRNALRVMRATGAAATGCEVHVPRQAHWIEATLHHLHFVGRSRFVHYINSANFFISAEVYRRLGGFKADLLTGEDAEIGHRITEAGHAIYESTEVTAYHLGNPKTVRQYYRRCVWHALGMFGTSGTRKLDKPTAMMVAHVLTSISGLVGLLSGLQQPATALISFLVAQLLIPTLTVAFRQHQTRRFGRFGQSLFLYWLYYWARFQALVLVASRMAQSYRK